MTRRQREIARLVVLVAAASLLLATSQEAPPATDVDHTTVIPAGATRVAIQVDAELDRGEHAGTELPFNGWVRVDSASLPGAGGTTSPPVRVDVAVDADEVVTEPQRTDNPFRSGHCDDDGCTASMTVVLTRRGPLDADVLVVMRMHLYAIDGIRGGPSRIETAVSDDSPRGAPAATPLPDDTTVVRLDRIGRGDAQVTITNYGDEAVTLSGGGLTTTVPAHASVLLEPFAACPRAGCTVRATADPPLHGASATRGPVLVSGASSASRRAFRERLRSPPESATVTLHGTAPTRRLTLEAQPEEPDASEPRAWISTSDTVFLVRAALIDGSDDAVVRISGWHAEPIVLSAFAGTDRVETTSPYGGDPGTVELLAGWARVRIEAVAIVADTTDAPADTRITTSVDVRRAP